MKWKDKKREPSFPLSLSRFAVFFFLTGSWRETRFIHQIFFWEEGGQISVRTQQERSKVTLTNASLDPSRSVMNKAPLNGCVCVCVLCSSSHLHPLLMHSQPYYYSVAGFFFPSVDSMTRQPKLWPVLNSKRGSHTQIRVASYKGEESSGGGNGL